MGSLLASETVFILFEGVISLKIIRWKFLRADMLSKRIIEIAGSIANSDGFGTDFLQVEHHSNTETNENYRILFAVFSFIPQPDP